MGREGILVPLIYVHNINKYKKNMSIITIVITLIIVGVLLWAVNEYIPMNDGIKKILNIVVIVAIIVWLIKVFNLLHYINL